MKNLLPIVLLLSLCFTACNKKDDTTTDDTTPAAESDHTPASEGDPAFTISGVRDIDLGAAGKGSITIPLSILQTSGRNRDTVSLSLFDLPAGVYGSTSTLFSTTPYNATLTITTDYSGGGGEVIAHLQGVGHSGRLSYPFRIIIPKYNGFESDGTTYRRDSVYVDTSTRPGNRFITMYSAKLNVRLILTFAKGVALPKANSKYRISNTPNDADAIQMQLYDFGHIYTATGLEERYGRFTFDTSGKFTFRCSDVELSDGFSRRRLSASFAQ